MKEYSANNDQKKRRDNFFCQFARQFFAEDQSEKGGWVIIPQALSNVDYSEREIKQFLDRLSEDGWIEVKDSAQAAPIYVRLTSVGKARAQVICKPVSIT